MPGDVWNRRRTVVFAHRNVSRCRALSGNEITRATSGNDWHDVTSPPSKKRTAGNGQLVRVLPSGLAALAPRLGVSKENLVQSMPDEIDKLQRAAAAIRAADALIIGAGAGMGVDSGLPDFRGPEGFWKAYPPYQKLGLNFVDLANPEWFEHDPALAWGFYGHRRNLYRKTKPHAGFAILRDWAAKMRRGYFVFTSNVDGHFQKAGFPDERIVEVHGSVDFMQCTRNCGAGIYLAEEAEIDVDEATMRAREPLPRCPRCGNLARPNILMFGDPAWDPARMRDQHTLLSRWAQADGGKVVVIECGAGRAIPTVRQFCERIAASTDGLLIRINKREFDVPTGHVGLPMAALEALQRIEI
jgi:NAD-dependent SIR2 family protein deacetylase